jgi:aspartate/methionine/tyrosine aminotransferase
LTVAQRERLRVTLPQGISWQDVTGLDRDILRLDRLTTDLRPPHTAIAASHAMQDIQHGSLPSFLGPSVPTLHAAILAWHGRGAGGDAEVLVAASQRDALTAGLLAVIAPRDEVLVLTPGSRDLERIVRLAGGVPLRVRRDVMDDRWRLNLDALSEVVTPSTVAIAIASPDAESGAVLDLPEWQAVSELCQALDLWLIHDASMQHLLYDDAEWIDPALLPGMSTRTLTVSSPEHELRMAGWPVGWLIGPSQIVRRAGETSRLALRAPGPADLAGVEAALRSSDNGVEASVGEWGRRRLTILRAFDGWPIVIPEGGWSLLLDAEALSMTPAKIVSLLRAESQIAARALDSRYVRLTFSAESVTRLRSIPARLRNTTLARRAAWAMARG